VKTYFLFFSVRQDGSEPCKSFPPQKCELVPQNEFSHEIVVGDCNEVEGVDTAGLGISKSRKTHTTSSSFNYYKEFGHVPSSSLTAAILDLIDWERGSSKKDESIERCSGCDAKQMLQSKTLPQDGKKGWQFWKEIDGVVISRKKSGRLFQCRGHGVLPFHVFTRYASMN
jgi:hypothetical protein